MPPLLPPSLNIDPFAGGTFLGTGGHPNIKVGGCRGDDIQGMKVNTASKNFGTKKVGAQGLEVNTVSSTLKA